MQTFLFGDQTYDIVSDLRSLLACRHKPLLQAFLEQAYHVIRAQMNLALPRAERKAYRTGNLAHLLSKYSEGQLSPAFQVALHTTTQLGAFISRFEEPGHPYPSADDTYVVGLCTGAVAAAAVSSSSSLSELLPAAVHSVLVAFRLGLCVTDMRDRVEMPEEGKRQEWSTVFYGLEENAAKKILDNMSASQNVPQSSRPWISATAGKATTISAAPSVMSKLIDEDSPLTKYKHQRIPIFVPSHASQLFTKEHITDILSTTNPANWIGFTSKIPVISGANGRIAWAGGFILLLDRALSECLLEPIGWDQVAQSFPEALRSRGVESMTVIPVASLMGQTLARSLQDSMSVIVESIAAVSSTDEKATPMARAKLAIVGASGRFPESQNLDAFWDLLYKGLDVCKEVPKKRWDVATHVDPTGKAHNKGATPWGCWLDFAGQFDPRFFSISPKEAPQMDPAQRMALMSTFEAMEMGGIVPDNTPSTQRDRVGVFHGVTSNDWMETNTAQDIDTYFITGGNRGFIPGRINFCFEFCGPSFTNDTACSSSLAAIHLACNSLWRGDCDTAIAGGTNMIFTPDGHTGLDKGFFLSRTGNCKAFDDNADGYCRAEGVGSIFIKRLDDALADNDPILAVILDTKTNHSAMSDSMTRPHVGAQIENMNAVLNNACVDPRSLSYVEMHGTGTQVGDAVEMESVLSVFARDEQYRGPEHPLWLGSAKANIGHGEGVSGVTSLIKVLLMMKNDTIPPHCGIKPGSKINHTFPDLNARNVHIAFKPTEWKRAADPRRVLINNFSAAGGNTAILLEDAPIRTSPATRDPRTSHVVTVSGHVVPSLKKNLLAMIKHLEDPHADNLSLPQLSWTTTARRVHHLFRVSVSGTSIADIKHKLVNAVNNGDGTTRAKTKPSILFAFTGQGAQWMGMGKQLYDTFPRFKADLLHMDKLCQKLGLPSFIDTITTEDGDIDQYPPTVVQLAVTSLEMAIARHLKHLGVEPHAVVGHSLGEYAALNIAGVLSVSDTLYLVGRRAQLLQERCNRGTHAMLAIKATEARVAELMASKPYEIACINGPEDVVLSGTNEHVEAAKAILSKAGLKSTLLKVPFAFHSQQVSAILPAVEEMAAGVQFRKPTIPILCPLTGETINEAGVVGPNYLARHCREAVNMHLALTNAQKAGLVNDKTLTIECGPHPVVCGMAKSILGSTLPTLPTLRRGGNVWKELSHLLATIYANGYDPDWVEYHAPFEGAHRVVELPAYEWDLKEYYIPYEGDWALHRHALECACADPNGPLNVTGKNIGWTSKNKDAKVIAAAPPTKPTPAKESKKDIVIPCPSTSTVHRVIEEKIEALGATLIVETDVSRKDVSNVSQGHQVNGIPLATPSVYADIGLTLGQYMMQRLRPGRPGISDVADLVVDKALIPHGLGPQLVRTKLTVTWAAKAAGNAKQANCEFYSVDSNGKTTTKHSWCKLNFLDRPTVLGAIQSNVPTYQQKIQRLRDGIKHGKFVKYNHTSGYKLMSNVAQFHPDFKLLQSLILDEDTLEACSTISIDKISSKGDFVAHPAYVDAITQVGGFAMNAKDSTDLDECVYVNHGWESFQVFEEPVPGKNYDVYVKMAPHGEDLYHGDTVVLDGAKVMAFFQGVSLRNVPRKALRMVLQQNMDKALRLAGKDPKAASVKPAATTASTPKPVQKPASQGPGPVAAPVPIAAAPVAAPAPVVVKAAVAPAFEQDPVASKKAEEALAIIAEESGIALSEMTDDVAFADVGIDSLMSMVIGSRLREELDLDLDADFSIFVDLPTVKELKAYFGCQPAVAVVEITAAASASQEPAEVVQVGVQVIPQPAPVVQQTASAQPQIQLKAAKAAAAPPTPSPLVAKALDIISEESGIVVEELTDDSAFADIGIDSLMSMVISSRLREELDLDLDADFSIFVDFPTVKDLKNFFNGGASSDDSSISDDYDFASGATTPPTDSDDEEEELPMIRKDRVESCRATPSVVMQGKPKGGKTIFILPDGSGSASSYLTIPKIGDDVCLIGLNCPYLRDPENMNCTHTALIASFCNEIRRRQPVGPYYLGGWSSGGAFAYVCAEALVNMGETVAGIIIIDAPVPQVMEHLPTSFYEYCNSIGLFGHETPPPYLIPHFEATVDTMMPYKVKPLNTSKMPKVGILWACDTVMDESKAPKMKGMHFMIQKRTDFGPDGWDRVLPGAQFVIDSVVGGNHFTLMAKENVNQVRDLIATIMA